MRSLPTAGVSAMAIDLYQSPSVKRGATDCWSRSLSVRTAALYSVNLTDFDHVNVMART